MKLYKTMKVGKTPLIQLSDKLFAKLESVNPGGSIKDRPVKYILDNAEENGLLKRGDTIVEATSGNTGISLAMMCAERGYKCHIVMPSDMSEERKKMLRFFGAKLTLVDKGDYATGKQVLVDDVDVSGQPSGTSIVYKIVSANSKQFKIHGTTVSWS